LSVAVLEIDRAEDRKSAASETRLERIEFEEAFRGCSSFRDATDAFEQFTLLDGHFVRYVLALAELLEQSKRVKKPPRLHE
jgi:hypothetical protein